jgi:hypothetical protein
MNEITTYRIVSERRWDVFFAWARALRINHFRSTWNEPVPVSSMGAARAQAAPQPSVDDSARERGAQLWKERVWDSDFFAQGY